MLKPEENERLTRVGPGTPAGTLFRRYWHPALLSSELPENDGAPVRVRLLGEDLIAYRDSTGKVGLVDAFCPHRRAPMFFGRNEECGLRCVYHGWKFDAGGACVDMPSEPPDSLFKTKVAIKAYPTFEGGGAIWTYMGPPELQPPEPDFEWVRAPETHRYTSKTFQDCNYLQAVEGGLDTAHSSFLHNEELGNTNWIRNRDGHPRLDVEKTDYGYYYVSTRTLDEENLWVRIYQYVMPAQQMRAGITGYHGRRAKVPKIDGHVWVPIDDEHTWTWNWNLAYDAEPFPSEYPEQWETFAGRGPNDLIPGTFKLKANLSNDFLIDRQLQKTKTFTGIRGINTQDIALQEAMGPVVDRSKEHLGTTDKAIIVLRQLLLEAVDEVERGSTPRGTDPQAYRLLRPFDDFIPKGSDWREVFAKDLIARW
jgi:phenylpropionate dioxygenase-like ring-hydroxylating dioxygenase large terminal subunit